MATSSIDQLITKYFSEECSNIEIVAYLNFHHGIMISLSTVKRRLSGLGLRRRVPKGCENRDEVVDEIKRQLLGSSKNLGIYC